jgi:demethylmenaquinone methyltransferase / 2-methoxy-6-polyprenyl-1,4-benzoquinol methylase
MKDTTHFGYEEVPTAEKSQRVKAVFDSVASKYDIMNDVMSLGVHRYWKSRAIETLDLEPGFRVLDLAGGTGDLGLKISPIVGKAGAVIIADINYSMLHVGRDRLLDEGVVGNSHWVQANAEHLPFPDQYFDRAIMGFGLRNVTDKQQALNDIFRTLKPGGKLLVLEFSKPTTAPLRQAYDVYSFSMLPMMGKLIANDADSYRYLAESIRKHPGQEELKSMFATAGFVGCGYENLTGGIVAMHTGFVPD